MATSIFKTNPVSLAKLLEQCHVGELQLPDFQRSWVWDEERIRSLIASISRSFPVGALMTLETGGSVNFKPRPVEGAHPSASQVTPKELLLDGQQRMTSLYQATLRNQVMLTQTPKGKRVKRWFYIDIVRALDPNVDRDEAIVSVPEDRVVRSNFDRTIDLDLSTPEKEIANKLFPLSRLFDWSGWQATYTTYMTPSLQQGDLTLLNDLNGIWARFKEEIVDAFLNYQVPVITLDQSSSKEAVCTVFEKVNTGGKPLDAFELITAMYAADGYELRKDWYGTHEHSGRVDRFAHMLRLPDATKGILADVSSTDFLHVISLFHTQELRQRAEQDGKPGASLPQITGNRAALLSLPLDAYIRYQTLAEEGFRRAAKFLYRLRIYRVFDLPYQAQVTALAAILARVGDDWEHAGNTARLVQWYWCGVFGELYGSTVETRVARDFVDVPRWLNGGPEPTTVTESTFRADRLKTMRMRLSAAYKGVNALLMSEGAQDFRTGQEFDHTIFLGEGVDIHHIFPQKWCTDHGISPDVFNSIINKTPLSYKTNRIIGGVAPSVYLAALERGNRDNPPIDPADLDRYLRGHLIDPTLIRADDFEGFVRDRQQQLIDLIARATGKQVVAEQTPAWDASDEGEVDLEERTDAVEAELTLSA